MSNMDDTTLDAPVLMDEDDREREDAANERIRKNLELTRRFMRAIFDDPAILDTIPDGASVILIPDDDPELAEANERGGRAMERAGKPVRFVGV